MNEKLEKIQASKLFRQLLLQNEHFTIAEMMRCVLRRNNFQNSQDLETLHFGATDVELISVLEKMIEETKDKDE